MSRVSELERQVADLKARLKAYEEAREGENLLSLRLCAIAADLAHVKYNGVRRQAVERKPVFGYREPYQWGSRADKLGDAFRKAQEELAAEYEKRLDRLVGQGWDVPLSDAEVERWLKGEAA